MAQQLEILQFMLLLFILLDFPVSRPSAACSQLTTPSEGMSDSGTHKLERMDREAAGLWGCKASPLCCAAIAVCDTINL